MEEWRHSIVRTHNPRLVKLKLKRYQTTEVLPKEQEARGPSPASGSQAWGSYIRKMSSQNIWL